MADGSADSPKRRVKNPETFRERAIRASETADKPGRTSRAKQIGGRAVSPVSKSAGRVARLKPFHWLSRPLRFIGRILFPTYFRNSWQELKRVQWPDWQSSRRLTVAVLGFAIVFGVTIAVIDYGLDKLFRNILLK